MSTLLKAAGALLVLLAITTPAAAQSTIAGTVRDTSGAVLPGVTVEATSDALIEKTRTAVTDGSGQYRIVDLRPGLYTVTFTLPGFSMYRRNDHGHWREPDRRCAEREAAADDRQRDDSIDSDGKGLLCPGRLDSEHDPERRRCIQRAAEPGHGRVRRPRRTRK